MGNDMLADEGLFAMTPQVSNLLRDRYTEPPFSVLDRRGRAWITRDKKWKALGIQSELGRDVKTFNMGMDYARPDGKPIGNPEATPQTSTFSPTLCEIVYRWYSAPGHRVLDPFAGGSVRGVVAGAMARDYTGIELRGEQVEANREQAWIAGDHPPAWIAGDSAEQVPTMRADGYEADLVFSCPPYAFLEKYSDDPADLSAMKYPEFLDVYRGIIEASCAALRNDRYAAWVIGEVRDPKTGAYVGLETDTVQAFRDAGLSLLNRHVLTTPIGTAAVRTPKQFDTSRKAGNIHEMLYVFVKGDVRAAAEAAGPLSGDLSTTTLDEDVADASAGGAA